MKKIFFGLFIMCLSLFAHDEYFLNIVDNKDNTITIIGDDDHKEGIAGALVKIESLVNGSILHQERLPNESKITISIPKEPYKVVLDAGNGNILTENGITPKEGFKVEVKAKEVAKQNNQAVSKPQAMQGDWNCLTIYFFTLCLILFGLAIFFSNNNTNKILRSLEELKKS